MRKAQWPDIQLSEQVLLSCDKQHRGCSGGWPFLAFKWIKDNGITDNTCSPYQALGYRNGLDCSSQVECMECTQQGCSAKNKFQKYYVDEFGFLSGEQEMMEEITQNGPIVCSWSTPLSIYTHKSGIYFDKTGRKSFDHEVEIIGFGVENGVKFWHIKNSWGTQYADDGFFKVVRGVNNIAIETNCSWALPLDTWSEGKEVIIDKSLDSHSEFLHKKDENYPLNNPDRIEKSYFIKGEKILSERPGELLKSSELPLNFDWRNVFDFNYVSRTLSQNTPHYWDSSWAFAPSSALADRFIIQHKRSETTIALNPQVLINCKAGGTCNGGNPGIVYEFAHTHGIPDSSCFNYEGVDYPNTCDPFNVCRDCLGAVRKIGESMLKNCRTIYDYDRYFVSEYGYVISKW